MPPTMLIGGRDHGMNWRWDLEWTFYDSLEATRNAWAATPAVSRAEVKPQQWTASTLVNHAANTLLPAHAFNGNSALWGLPVEKAKGTDIVAATDLTDVAWTATGITATKVATDPAGTANNAWKLVSADNASNIENATAVSCNNKTVQNGIWARIDPAATPATWTAGTTLRRADDAESFSHNLALTKTWKYFPLEDVFADIAVVDDTLQFKISSDPAGLPGTPPAINVYLPWCKINSLCLQSPVASAVSADDVTFPLGAAMLSALSGTQGSAFIEAVPLCPYTENNYFFIIAPINSNPLSFVMLLNAVGSYGAMTNDGTNASVAAISSSDSNCGRGKVVKVACSWNASALKFFVGGVLAATTPTPYLGDAALPAGSTIYLQASGLGLDTACLLRRMRLSRYVFPDNYLINLTK